MLLHIDRAALATARATECDERDWRSVVCLIMADIKEFR